MPRVVVFDTFGGPEVLHIIDEPVTVPAAGEVRIRIEAFAINPLDAMMRSGTSPAPVHLPRARLGIEGTGAVDDTGPGVTGLRIGDPVIITAILEPAVRGSYADYITLPASSVTPRPDGLDTVHAAAIWVAFSTAYGALTEAAHMRPGDRILISGASGAVGRAAIQIANQIGALPIAITRNTAKTSELRDAGAATVIATDHQDMLQEVLHATDGSGADIVLDLVKGPGQRDLITATRRGGTLVAAGFLDPRPTPDVDGSTPVTVMNYRGFDYLLNPVIVRRMAAFLNTDARLDALRPAIDTVFRFEEVAEAHHRFDKGLNAGKKIIVTT